MHMATEMNSVALSSGPWGDVAADGTSEEEEMADVDRIEAMGKAKEVMMTETGIASTTAI
jgi:hypothetical protein